MEDVSQVGKPVFGDEFIGRENEIKQLINLVKSGQSIVIMAPRRYGKTSLINKVLDLLKQEEKFLTSYIDIFTTPDLKRLSEQITTRLLENKKLDQLVHQVKKGVGEMFKNIEFKNTIEEFEFVLKFGNAQVNEWELLENSLDFVEQFAIKHKTISVLGLDEFGDIEKLGGAELTKMMRGKMQMQKNVSVIFSGSHESVMNHLFTTSKSPFYRFARIFTIGNIDKNSFKNLYIDKLTKSSIKPDAPLINKILDFTGGHPYYSNLFLQQWLLLRPEGAYVEEKYKCLLESLLVVELPYIENLWADVSSSREHRTVTLSLAAQNKPYSSIDVRTTNVSRTLKALLNKGMVFKTRNGYVFADPLFEYWLRTVVLGD